VQGFLTTRKIPLFLIFAYTTLKILFLKYNMYTSLCEGLRPGAGLPPVFVVLLEHGHTRNLHVIYGSFRESCGGRRVIKAERDHEASKPKIPTNWPFKKKVPDP